MLENKLKLVEPIARLWQPIHFFLFFFLIPSNSLHLCLLLSAPLFIVTATREFPPDKAVLIYNPERMWAEFYP